MNASFELMDRLLESNYRNAIAAGAIPGHDAIAVVERGVQLLVYSATNCTYSRTEVRPTKRLARHVIEKLKEAVAFAESQMDTLDD